MNRKFLNQNKKKNKENEKLREHPRAVRQYPRCSIHITGIPEGKARENGSEEIFKVIMAKNFPKLMADTKR